MSLTVIATLHPLEGQRDSVLAATLRAVPHVLEEEGCLGYAPYTVGKDGLIIIESWSGGEALKAHGAGSPLADFQASVKDIVSAPADVVVARPVEVGTEG